MKFHFYFLLLTSAFILASSKGMSQGVVSAPDKPDSDQLFINIGLEPELVTTIGYTQLIGKMGKNFGYHLGGSLKFAPLIIPNRAWRVNVINKAIWRLSETLKIQFATQLYLAHDNNRAGELNGLGNELRATLMQFGNTWAKGLEFGWQYTILTHIKHSEEAKNTFMDRYPVGEKGFDGPKDGWYGATVHRFRLGFAGSKKLGDQWRLQVGLGALLSLQKQGILLGFSHAQVPVYLESTLSYCY